MHTCILLIIKPHTIVQKNYIENSILNIINILNIFYSSITDKLSASNLV